MTALREKMGSIERFAELAKQVLQERWPSGEGTLMGYALIAVARK